MELRMSGREAGRKGGDYPLAIAVAVMQSRCDEEKGDDYTNPIASPRMYTNA